MARLEVQYEQLTHTAYFSRPLIELWGDGRKVMGGLYDAFHPFGANWSDIRIEGGSPADQVVLVPLGQAVTHRFRFDRVETTFLNFSDKDFLERLPAVLQASLGWIRGAVTNVSVSTHQFVHTTHGKIQGQTVGAVLQGFSPTVPRVQGESDGAGAIFHWNVPEKKWVVQLTLDKSLAIQGGLFVMLSLVVLLDKIDFRTLAIEGREYLIRALQALSIEWPS